MPIEISFWRLSNGNINGRYKNYRIHIHKMGHGGFYAYIKMDGWIAQEGFFATSLPSEEHAKAWAKTQIQKHLELC